MLLSLSSTEALPLSSSTRVTVKDLLVVSVSCRVPPLAGQAFDCADSTFPPQTVVVTSSNTSSSRASLVLPVRDGALVPSTRKGTTNRLWRGRGLVGIARALSSLTNTDGSTLTLLSAGTVVLTHS